MHGCGGTLVASNPRNANVESLPNAMAKGIRKNITVPGLLAPALRLLGREAGTSQSVIVERKAYEPREPVHLVE